MPMMKTFAKRALQGVLLLVAALILIAAGLTAHGEWQRHFDRAPVPPLPAVPAGNGPVLILLHGAGLNGHMWDAMRRSLDPGLRVMALDLPGHGLHSPGVYSLEATTEEIVAAARAVAPSPVILVGDSLGGYSAMAAASSIPAGQLRGLVMGGSSANFGVSNALRYPLDLLFIHTLLTLKNPEELAQLALVKLGVAPVDRGAILAAGVRMNAVAPATRAMAFVDFRAKLAQLDLPVLIVNGSLDKRAVEQEDSFFAVLKHGSRYRFENCEHGVSMRRPAELAKVVNDFVGKVVSP